MIYESCLQIDAPIHAIARHSSSCADDGYPRDVQTTPNPHGRRIPDEGSGADRRGGPSQDVQQSECGQVDPFV